MYNAPFLFFFDNGRYTFSLSSFFDYSKQRQYPSTTSCNINMLVFKPCGIKHFDVQGKETRTDRIKQSKRCKYLKLIEKKSVYFFHVYIKPILLQMYLPEDLVNIFFFICMLHRNNQVGTLHLPEGKMTITQSIHVEKYSVYYSFSWPMQEN